MEFWDYASIVAIMVVLAVGWWLLRRLDHHAKVKSRDRAYKLLDMDNPPIKDMKNTIRELNLYGGRLKRNKEFLQLRQRLTQKMDAMGSPSAK